MSTALVTGCSTGIGFSTALRLARDGFDVVATMRAPEVDGARLLDAAHAHDLDLTVRALDVRSDDSVQRCFDDIEDLAVLVNNAGIMSFGSIEQTTVAAWQDVFETNVFGAVRCVRAALPRLRGRTDGCIVNISSGAGAVSLPGLGAYVASKAALEVLGEVTAAEGFAHGIRVVVLQVGATATTIAGKTQPPDRDDPSFGAIRNSLAFLGAQMRSPSSPEEIADAVAEAVRDPSTPFRVRVGQGTEPLLHFRRALTDEAWIPTVGGPLDQFCQRYAEITGEALR